MPTNVIQLENKTARRFVGFIEEFRKLNTEMGAHQISLFLNIVAQPDLTVREYSQRTGIPLGGTITRNLDYLTEEFMERDRETKQMVRKPGHGLIDTYNDPEDRRIRRARPTEKGKRVYASLVQLLGS